MSSLSQVHQTLGLLQVNRKRLFRVDVFARFQTSTGDGVVALRVGKVND
jgi:hypothetical protein